MQYYKIGLSGPAGRRRASARRTENGGPGIFFFSAIRAAAHYPQPKPESAARGDAPAPFQSRVPYL